MSPTCSSTPATGTSWSAAPWAMKYGNDRALPSRGTDVPSEVHRPGPAGWTMSPLTRMPHTGGPAITTALANRSG